MGATPPQHVLVIDDDADTRANLCDILELDGYHVETASTLTEGLDRKNWFSLTAIILDRKLPDGLAESALPRFKQLAPQASVLIVTGYADLQAVISALREGAADFIVKPIDAQGLRASLARAAARQRLTVAKERSEAAFRTLVEAAPCMIVIFRSDFSILYFSPFAEELSGYSSATVQGRSYSSIFVPKDYQKELDNGMQKVLAGKSIRALESPIICKDGTPRWMIWNVQYLKDYEGGPAILSVGQDITSLKQAQNQIVQAERLAAIGQMMTGLAHESGNALARSQACLEMLSLEVEDRPEALDLVARIQKAQNALQQLYEEVRGYAAPLKLDLEKWDVSGIWRQAWSDLAVVRQEREAVLQEKITGVDLHCKVDQFRLAQVFRNILENSLAACPNSVVIEISCSEAKIRGKPGVRIRVQDNGPGLTPEQRTRIFEPFYTTKTKGTGLGMAIAKRIIEAHGGNIEVGNGPGPGAEIIVALPRNSL